MDRDYYKVLLVGQSGKGKTYSFRNMNPETTGFLNIEDKPLPFKNRFKYHLRPRTVAQAKEGLKQLADNKDVTAICIDSFSAYIEKLLSEARASKKGFDIWNYYNEEIGRFLDFIKSINKEVFITTHYEINDIEGNQEKRVKVKGKEWENLIEKEFTVVLYADNEFTKGKPEYFFRTVMEGSSTKCPPGLVAEEGSMTIENDTAKVLENILKFVN